MIISLVNNMSLSIHLQRLSLKAKLFRGLGDSIRLSILELLCDGEKSTSEILGIFKTNAITKQMYEELRKEVAP